MDNPQHYQPLSHALNPPSSNSLNRSHYAPQPTTSYTNHQPILQPVQPAQPHNPEEEDDDDEEDDEGLVEEQLSRHDADIHDSNPSSPKITGPTPVQPTQAPQEDQPEHEPERKRRPGRPRGSKNRKHRGDAVKQPQQQQQQPQPQPQQQSYYYQNQTTPLPQAAPPTLAGPPQHPNINPQNQQYYEFQWRVLNLCAEFYGAAEELVKKTPPLVVAQCYHLGPGIKIDPINMLAEAKRVCDTLLANPSQLVTNPPPPMRPVLPTLCQPFTQPQTSTTPHVAPTAATPAASTSTPTKTPVITHPQSFAVPLSTQPVYPQYPVYTASSYPAPSYYPPYAPYPPGAYYPQAALVAPTAQPQPVAVASPSSASVGPTATTNTVLGNQGPWSDEETERLKKLAEESRAKNGSTDIDWEWLIREWGATRTRHQILVKATALGLKESTSRGTKRRRDENGAVETSTSSSSTAVTPVAPQSQPSQSANTPTSTSAVGLTATTSPRATGTGTATPTPGASPALAHTQRPPSTIQSQAVGAAPPPIIPSKMPWPMPTVASTGGPSPQQHQQMQQQQQQRTDYYRQRPQDGATAKAAATTLPPQQLTYSMYTPNGQLTQTPMRTKENGK